MSTSEEENMTSSLGWETVESPTSGKIIRRRTYTIPAPGSAAAESATATSKKKKQKPMSKQQRMLRQIKAQRELEQSQQEVVTMYADGAFSDLMTKYLKTIGMVIVIGLALLYYYAPDNKLLSKLVLNKLWFLKQRITSRSLVTVYPKHLTVRQDLPLVYSIYSVSKPENAKAREAVVHVASLRGAAIQKDTTTMYYQPVKLHAWEHSEFLKQTEANMGRYCGSNFEKKYKDNDETAKATTTSTVKDDLLLWCFLANGHHDGYVKYQIKSLHSGIVRGTKGVAIRRLGSDGNGNANKVRRIHSDSLLLLPIHEYKDIQGDSWLWKFITSGGTYMFSSGNNNSDDQKKRKKELPPSTMVAYAALEWLNVNAGSGAVSNRAAYIRLFEEFLYEWIGGEKDKWIIWDAACTPQQRLERLTTQRLIGTTCATIVDDDNNINNTSVVQLVVENNDDCCHFFDPNLEPLRKYKYLALGSKQQDQQQKQQQEQKENEQQKEETISLVDDDNDDKKDEL